MRRRGCLKEAQKSSCEDFQGPKAGLAFCLALHDFAAMDKFAFENFNYSTLKMVRKSCIL